MLNNWIQSGIAALCDLRQGQSLIGYRQQFQDLNSTMAGETTDKPLQLARRRCQFHASYYTQGFNVFTFMKTWKQSISMSRIGA